jgi:rod shape-determining protein MreC
MKIFLLEVFVNNRNCGILAFVRVIPFVQVFLSLILISLVFLGLDFIKALSIPKTAIYTITNPISLGIYKTSQGVGRQFYFVFAARFAAQDNKALKEQLGQLSTENANMSRKLAELETQVAQEQKLDPATYKTIPARPLGVDRGILKIDRGSNDGVKVNSAVVFKDNFVGKVTSVSERGATVMLSSNPNSKVGAFSISKDGKARGLLIGKFETELIFDQILHEEPIAKGDLVYSQGTEGYLPRGLVLGEVSEVIGKEHELFKQAKVKGLFDVKDFDLVFVIQE